MKQGVRKKRRKKLGIKDKVHAVLAAAVLILAALTASLVVAHLHSVKVRNEAALVQGSPPAPAAQTPPPPAQPAAPPPPVQAPVAQAPAVQAPVAQAPAVRTPAEKPPEQKPDSPRQSNPAVAPGGIIERPPYKGALAFVIDDAGNNLRDLEPFLKLKGPVTIAVLPGLPNSAEAARRVRAAGKEVFLHQPMESLGGRNPGPGAIMAGMGREEIRAIIRANLDEVGPVAGINNHEGSRITGDDDAMDTILALCRERGIVFLDSRTTAETAAPRAARRQGIVIGEMDIFIDNVQERESMAGYINTGLSKAEQQGSAIMIGHVTSPELAPLLAKLFSEFGEQGYSLAPASNLIRGTKP